MKKERIEEIVAVQAMEMIMLNESFYATMEEGTSDDGVFNRILEESLDMEQKCLDLAWIPFLYSIVARCYYGLGNIDMAIAYSRDSLLLSKLEAYKTKNKAQNENLHSLKTQRDIAMGVNDIEKALSLQEEILKITPYLEDEIEIKRVFLDISDIFLKKQLNMDYVSYDERCKIIRWKTKMMQLDSVEKVKAEEAARAEKFLNKG